MSLELKTPAGGDPVALEDVRRHCRLVATDTTHDVELRRLLKAAVEQYEEVANRALVTRTLVLRRDSWPARGVVWLRPGPVQSVTSVKYTDGAGVEQTLVADTDYTVDIYSDPARVVPAYGKSWPTARAVPNAVVVEFVAGYGADHEDIPRPARQAILLAVGQMWSYREAALDIPGGKVQPLAGPGAYNALMDVDRDFDAGADDEAV